MFNIIFEKYSQISTKILSQVNLVNDFSKRSVMLSIMFAIPFRRSFLFRPRAHHFHLWFLFKEFCQDIRISIIFNLESFKDFDQSFQTLDDFVFLGYLLLDLLVFLSYLFLLLSALSTRVSYKLTKSAFASYYFRSE